MGRGAGMYGDFRTGLYHFLTDMLAPYSFICHHKIWKLQASLIDGICLQHLLKVFFSLSPAWVESSFLTSDSKQLWQSTALHRGAFCQFLFRWIYYCHSSKSTGKETGKSTSVHCITTVDCHSFFESHIKFPLRQNNQLCEMIMKEDCSPNTSNVYICCSLKVFFFWKVAC